MSTRYHHRWARFTNSLNNLRHEFLYDPWNHIGLVGGFVVAPIGVAYENAGLTILGLVCFVLGIALGKR